MSFNVTAFLNLLPTVISVISEAAKLVPASGAVPKYLDILAAITAQGEAAYNQLSSLKDLVANMVNMQREPTDEEWAALAARSDIASDEIQSYDFDSELPAPIEVQPVPEAPKG